MVSNAIPLDKSDDNTIQEICTVLTGNFRFVLLLSKYGRLMSVEVSHPYTCTNTRVNSVYHAPNRY
jgi:hypothetical protein